MATRKKRASAAARQAYERRAPSDIDRHVGARLKQARLTRGLKLKEVGAFTGNTGNYIHKLEAGSTRLSITKLHLIAAGLDLPESYFFAGLRSEEPIETLVGDADPIARVTAEVFHMWQRIGSEARTHIHGLMRAILKGRSGSDD